MHTFPHLCLPPHVLSGVTVQYEEEQYSVDEETGCVTLALVWREKLQSLGQCLCEHWTCWIAVLGMLSLVSYILEFASS